MIKKLFFLFVFFAPFTSFFAITAWLRLPVIVNQFLFLFLTIGVFQTGIIKKKWVLKEDLYLALFLIFVWFSYLLGFLERRSFNHALAYTNATFFYFFISKYTIGYLKVSSIEITKIIYWSFLACSTIILADFIGKNYYNLSFREIFTNVDGKISNMNYYIRFGYFRVGGVAEEPGTMALFYNIYFGLSLYYLSIKQEVRKFKWIIFLFTLCHFSMLSNAGIALVILATIIIFILNKINKLTISKNQLFLGLSIFIVLIIIVIVIFYFNLANSTAIAEEFMAKIFFSEENYDYSSSGQRLKQWARAISNFAQRPILGHGPGYGVNEDQEGYLSVYLTILADIGLLAFLLFIAFQDVLIRKAMKLSKPIRNFLLFSIITSFLHLIIVSDFYHAPIWILFVMIQLIYKEQTAS